MSRRAGGTRWRWALGAVQRASGRDPVGPWVHWCIGATRMQCIEPARALFALCKHPLAASAAAAQPTPAPLFPLPSSFFADGDGEARRGRRGADSTSGRAMLMDGHESRGWQSDTGQEPAPGPSGAGGAETPMSWPGGGREAAGGEMSGDAQRGAAYRLASCVQFLVVKLS